MYCCDLPVLYVVYTCYIIHLLLDTTVCHVLVDLPVVPYPILYMYMYMLYSTPTPRR